jgi:hypothetical protein
LEESVKEMPGEIPPKMEVGAAESSFVQFRELALLLLLLNTLSAVLFICFVNRPVYDDSYNLSDVRRYAAQGVSVETIRAHVNPPGPTSFLWMAAAARLLGGNELVAARVAVLLSWLLLGAGMLVLGRYGSSGGLCCAALLVTLVFPHTLTATATVLTEGPALLFATLGAFLWVEGLSKAILRWQHFAMATAGGLMIGLAVTCRQYYLAIVLAAGVWAVGAFWKRGQQKNALWIASAVVSLIAAAVPIAVLIVVWGGFSSPGMVSGLSYGTWKSSVGLNLERPLVACFYVACYLLPLTFPLMRPARPVPRRLGLLIAAFAGVGAVLFSSGLLQPGPLNSMLNVLGAFPFLRLLLFGLLAGVFAYNAFGWVLALRAQWSDLTPHPIIVLALLTIAFFIVEQAGIGGNVPFYDRYVLQIAPFIGLVTLPLLPRLGFVRLAALASLCLLSNVMLWRYALRT